MRRTIDAVRKDHLLTLGIFGYVLSAIAIRLYILYLPFRTFGYLVPPGQDPVNHYRMVEEVLNGNLNFSYPKLFHFLIAKISLISGLGVMDTLKFVTPALVILPALAIYIFARRQFGRLAAIISFSIAIFATNYALIAFGDGNYPNILAAGFFMPLALLFLIESFKKASIKNYLLTILFTVLVILTHHLTTATMIVIVFSYILVMGIWQAKEKIAPNFKRTALAIIVTGVLIAIIVSSTSLSMMFKSAWESFKSTGDFFGSSIFAKPIVFDEYAPQVGYLTWYGGIIALFGLVYLLGRKEEKKNRPAYLLLIVWIAVLFIMSRMETFGLPGRFARELAVPLILSLGLVLSYIIQRMQNNYQKILASGLFGFIIVMNLSQVNSGIYRAPDYFKPMIWYSFDDQKEAEAINALAGTSPVIANPTSPYLPIFASRQVLFPTVSMINTKEKFDLYVKANNPKYVLVGQKTAANPDGETYSFFKEFDTLSGLLREYTQKFPVVASFADGSKIYQITGMVSKSKT